ncbi:hypothetical protein AB0D09_08790 [Streptomyces sp. NPDC049097]|uniref:hypothetical protein n=1 Tax=Streptomyces sp. NPDC049097 TaxID=3155497 RepID=UPI00343A26B5
MTTETDGARAYLWDLQAQVADARGQSGRYANERMLLREFAERLLPEEQLDAETKDALKLRQYWPPCGPEESYSGYSIIHGLADRIERYIPNSFTRPVLGMLETGEINAVTLLAPDMLTHLVVFESGLADFANLFSKAVALAMPFGDFGKGKIGFSVNLDNVRRHLADSPDAIRRFREVVLAYLLKGEPGQAPQYFAPHPIDMQASMLRDGLELFVLGHEYGHVLANHLADSHNPRRLLGTALGELTEVTWKWEQEHEADLLGWLLCAQVMNEKYVLPFSHACVELFFSACEVLERALSLLVMGRNDLRHASPTHPPISSRRDVVRGFLRERVKGEVESAIILGTAIHNIVDILWEHTAPVVLDLHQGGAQPAPRWTTNFAA